MTWAFLAGVVPLYPLYALLFADAGLSDGEISVLFTVWSVVGVVAELPTGVLADRWPRQYALVAGSVLQAVGFAGWTTFPDFAGFAAGFVLWGVGGAFISGADEALLYDGLASRDGGDAFPAVLARARAAELVAQAPAAGAASLLFWLGGYPLAGWVSVAVCLGVGALASRLRERPESGSGVTPLAPSAVTEPEPTLRDAVAVLASDRRLRLLVVWVAALTGLDAVEEYVPLLARHWTLPVEAVPAAVLAFSLAGAVGAASGHRLVGVGDRGSGGLVVLAGVLLGVASSATPVALVAALVFYAVYQAVLVPAGARLQDAVESRHRATLTSAAALGSEATALACYAAWAGGQGRGLALLVVGVGVAAVLLLPRALRASASPAAS